MNETKLSPDDPRLTAYALGELEGDEQAAVEAALKTDDAAQAVVAEIRATARQLEAALASEAEIILPPVAARHVAPYAPARKLVHFPYWIVAGLAAAGFAVMLALREPQVVRVAEQQKVAVAQAGAKQAQAFDAVQNKSAVVAAGENQQGYTEIALAAPAAVNQAPLEKVEADKMAVSADASAGKPPETGEIIQLSPFNVMATKDGDYRAANTVTTGTRTRVATPIKDLPFAVGAYPGDFKKTYAPAPSTTLPAANTESYAYHADSDFLSVAQNPLSTFALDVDTASYANVRRFLQAGEMPPADAVRIEELVNYFPYAYAAPGDDTPLAVTLEVAAAPWAPTHRLVRIGLKAREVTAAARPAKNLVFLIDVSGSMDEPSKLPLVQQSLRLLLDQLRPDDRVAIVVYAGESGLALPSTPASHRREILDALDALHAGGGTNGARGLELAYDIAKANFITGGVNRVILATGRRLQCRRDERGRAGAAGRGESPLGGGADGARFWHGQLQGRDVRATGRQGPWQLRLH
jgi:Ca-activated chloride channel family protein